MCVSGGGGFSHSVASVNNYPSLGVDGGTPEVGSWLIAWSIDIVHASTVGPHCR